MPLKTYSNDDQKALDYFDNKETPDNRVLKLHRKSSPYHEIKDPAVQDSYIKIKNSIYRLKPSEKRGGTIAGMGGEGTVKYVDKLSSSVSPPQSLTVKIDNVESAQKHNNPLNRDMTDENEISLDVGLFLDVASRTKPRKPSKGRYRSLLHRYAVMPDLGKELLVYLYDHQATISDHQRIQFAIGACLEVYKLHAGISPKSGRPIAHGDIKLENFLYNAKTGKVKLGDYGFAEYGPTQKATNLRGTPRNLPFISNHYQLNQYTLEELDIFALKRSCYVPEITLQRGLGVQETTEDFYSILPKRLLEKKGIYDYFATGMEEGEYHSALFLTHAAILALFNKAELVSDDETTQKALLVLYSADALTEESLKNVFSDQDYRTQLARLIQTIENISKQDLPSEDRMLISTEESLDPPPEDDSAQWTHAF